MNLNNPGWLLAAAATAALEMRIEVCNGPNCCAAALQSFRRAATDMEVVEVGCLDQCDRGPNARVVVDEVPAIFGADAMTGPERQTKVFADVASDARVHHIYACATRLRDRLVPSPPPPPTRNPVDFFKGYSESELRSVLDLHETLRDHQGMPEDMIDDDSPSVFDLHAIVQSVVAADGASDEPNNNNNNNNNNNGHGSSHTPR